MIFFVVIEINIIMFVILGCLLDCSNDSNSESKFLYQLCNKLIFKFQTF